PAGKPPESCSEFASCARPGTVVAREAAPCLRNGTSPYTREIAFRFGSAATPAASSAHSSIVPGAAAAASDVAQDGARATTPLQSARAAQPPTGHCDAAGLRATRHTRRPPDHVQLGGGVYR